MKIKKDKLGLYAEAGGWIIRPFFGTNFGEGDDVKTHHFGGTTFAGVTYNVKDLNFNKKGSPSFEYWGTSGVFIEDYKSKKVTSILDEGKTFEESLSDSYDWYRKHSEKFYNLYSKKNKEFYEFIYKRIMAMHKYLYEAETREISEAVEFYTKQDDAIKRNNKNNNSKSQSDSRSLV